MAPTIPDFGIDRGDGPQFRRANEVEPIGQRHGIAVLVVNSQLLAVALDPRLVNLIGISPRVLLHAGAFGDPDCVDCLRLGSGIDDTWVELDSEIVDIDDGKNDPVVVALFQIDVRVIAATNKDLMKEVEAKTFRLDLYHRLSVILIHVPSLNQRREDIPLLVNHFLDDICTDYGMPRKMISDDAMKLLQDYDWTGNIRELRNVVERLVILSNKSITRDDVKAYVLPK